MYQTLSSLQCYVSKLTKNQQHKTCFCMRNPSISHHLCMKLYYIVACMEIGVTLCIYILLLQKLSYKKTLEIPLTFVTGLISIKPNMNISINLCDMSETDSVQRAFSSTDLCRF